MPDDADFDTFECDLIEYLAERLQLPPEVVRVRLAASLLEQKPPERDESWQRYLRRAR
jgi:hypothetical protein